jgi:hypothetical protein
MAEHTDPMRERELARRRDNEEKDLEVESSHEERPLEGLSAAPTTWTPEQDDGPAREVHSDDEERSVNASKAQIPPHNVDPLPEG